MGRTGSRLSLPHCFSPDAMFDVPNELIMDAKASCDKGL